MQKPDISIIVATYNYAGVLPRVLERVLAAEVPEGVRREIIVVDNNSTDDTASVVKGFADRDSSVIYLLQRERGTSNARNLGILRARGKLLLFTDHDVFVDKRWIRAFWELFQNEDVEVAQGRILWERDIGKIPPWLEPTALPYYDPPVETQYTKELIACNIAVRKEIFEIYGFFSPWLGPGKMGGGEDSELAARLISFGVKLHYHREALVYHESIAERMGVPEYRDRMRMTGRCMGTIKALVKWEPPRRYRTVLRLIRDCLKYSRARLVGSRDQALKREMKISYRRGVLAGVRESLRTRREICRRTQVLSACIITQNKACLLERALKSIEDFCDEIIVVDGGSSDNTAEVARSFGKVKYFLHPCPDSSAKQKNWAFTQAQGDWILTMDDDEVAGPCLRSAIRRLIRDARHTSFRFPRHWLVSESPRRCATSRELCPDYQERLFRNLPKFRYMQDSSVRHRFPESIEGKGQKVVGARIIDHHFIDSGKATEARL